MAKFITHIISHTKQFKLKLTMEKLNLSTQFKPKAYLRLGLTIFLILFAGKFVINDALPYFGFNKETFGSPVFDDVVMRPETE